MKKLLNELEAKKNSYNQSGDYTTGKIQGLMIAIGIVRAHNPWHEVTDGLPEKRTDNYVSKGTLSVRVMLYDANENRHEIGYYYFDESRWCNFGQLDIRPTHWAYLPELPK